MNTRYEKNIDLNQVINYLICNRRSRRIWKRWA